MPKRQKHIPERVSAIFSRMLNGKPDEHRTVLELERDIEEGNMNIPGALVHVHIVTGRVPDGVYTLTYSGKSEQVGVQRNTVVRNQREM